MDSVVKLGHQIKGDPVIRVCYLLQAYHFNLLRMEKSPSDCFRLPCTGIFFFIKKLFTFEGIHFYCRQVLSC